VEKKENSL